MPKVPKIINLQYIKKEVSNEVDFFVQIDIKVFNKEVSCEVIFLHADKHQIFLQSDPIFLMGLARHARSAQTSLHYLRDISSKKLQMKLQYFLHAGKHQCFP